jgi:hypothetical protein
MLWPKRPPTPPLLALAERGSFVPQYGVFSKVEFPAHASGADETLVSFGFRSNRRRLGVCVEVGESQRERQLQILGKAIFSGILP